MYHFILQLNKMPVEKLEPKDGFQEFISEVEELKSKISKPVGKIAEWLGKLWEKQKERLEKKSLNFLEAKKNNKVWLWKILYWKWSCWNRKEVRF